MKRPQILVVAVLVGSLSGCAQQMAEVRPQTHAAPALPAWIDVANTEHNEVRELDLRYSDAQLDRWANLAARKSPVARYIREVSLWGRYPDRIFIGTGQRRDEVTAWLADRIPRRAFVVRHVRIPVARWLPLAWK
ncbi:MAG: hypothetical protein ACRDI3_01540 [Actinomycetota bacterium]